MNNIFKFTGHVQIIDETTGKVLLDKHNAIHPQNMSRIIARKLANEPNSTFYRLAFGDGGTFVDGSGNHILRSPNDGTNGAGWESRLYSETYSEIIDNEDSAFGDDIGSAGPDNVRLVGGANAGRDISLGPKGVTSSEINTESNVVIDMVINEYEPLGEDRTFAFDEMGIYSTGAPALDTVGVSTISLAGANNTSESDIFPPLPGATIYSIRVDLDGVEQDALLTTPAAGTGSGTAGAFTYGDLCEGINSGAWISGSSPFDFSSAEGATFFITDTTGGTYPSITGEDSHGFLGVKSKSIGEGSSVSFPADTIVLNEPNLFYFLARENWNRVNVNIKAGDNMGVRNNPVTTENERERLLTHLTFPTIGKEASSRIRILYTITINVGECSTGLNFTSEVVTL